MTSTPEKALIIRFSSIGDILLSSLLLRVFRRRFPACRVDYLVKSDYAELVGGNPNVTNVIPFGERGGFASLRELRAKVRSAGYDMILDIHDSLRSRYVSAGHPHVRRINKRKLARFLLIRTKRNLYHRFGGSPGVAQRYLETVSDLGIEDDGKGLELNVPPSARAEAENVLTGHPSPIVGIAPSAVHANKRWRPVGFAETALNLCGTGGTAVLFGSQEDRHLCSIIEHMIVAQKPEVHVLNTAGTTALPVAAALMDHCEIVISNDSGLMHLAAARGRKVVAIFGPTVREFGFFPFGTEFRVVEHRTLDCRPCTHIGLPDCPRGHFRCMNDITADMVTGAARELLDSRQ